MKKLLITLFVILTCCAFFVAGCDKSSPINVPTPEGFTLDAKGCLSWDEVANATEYRVKYEGNTTSVSENEVDLVSLITKAGENTVSVAAVVGGKEGTAGSYSLNAVKLGKPTKPTVNIDQTTHAVKFIWTGDANTQSYLQSVNSGKWANNANTYFEPTASGDYVIKVKAKAYAVNNTLYLESDESDPSDSYTHIQGPVLSIAGINAISWTSEATFDSYNLLINGVKVKENISPSSGYNLITGSNPAITKTGVYDIQLEAIKNGQKYYSNIQENVPSSNINTNELYSFDNNDVYFSIIKDGVSVSNEKYHGDAGYSLKVEVKSDVQLYLQKNAYPGFSNDIDFRKIKKVSFWVYVDPISGLNQFPKDSVPGWGWEKKWTAVDGETKTATKKSTVFATNNDIAMGEWVKIELDNLETIYDNIFVISVPKTLTEDYVLYIDDIYFEELYVDSTPAKADYVLEYNYAAAYNKDTVGYNYVEFDMGVVNADQEFDISMDVCGNALATYGSNALGIVSNVAKDTDPTDIKKTFIDADKLSVTNAWTNVTIKVKTDSEGKFYLTAMQESDTHSAYEIYIKDIKALGGQDLEYFGCKNMKARGQGGKTLDLYYQSFGVIEVDLPVGTYVKVEMDVKVTGKFNEWCGIVPVKTANAPLYTTSSGGNVITKTIITGEEGWHHVVFVAWVNNFNQMRWGGEYSIVDFSAYGNGVYLACISKSADTFSYTNVEVSQIYSATAGQSNGSAENEYFESVTVLKSDEVITDGREVIVEMDIKLTGTFDENSKLVWVDSVTGDVCDDCTPIDISTLKSGWNSISFRAKPRNFSALRDSTDYTAVDTSEAGLGVYLLCVNKKNVSFDYANLKVYEPYQSLQLVETRKNVNDLYYETFAFLATDFDLNTKVSIEMDVRITGTYNAYSNIVPVKSISNTKDTSSGGNVITSKIVTGEDGWHHVTFYAWVVNLDAFRWNAEYDVYDCSEYGNGIYIVSVTKTPESFDYKNVSITVYSE